MGNELLRPTILDSEKLVKAALNAEQEGLKGARHSSWLECVAPSCEAVLKACHSSVTYAWYLQESPYCYFRVSMYILSSYTEP